MGQDFTQNPLFKRLARSDFYGLEPMFVKYARDVTEILVQVVERQDRLLRESFNDLLLQLTAKIDALAVDLPGDSPIMQRATALRCALDGAANTFFAENPREQAHIEHFRQVVHGAIDAAMPVFAQHRGWGDWNVILRGFLGVLAMLAIIPAVVVACKAKQSFGATFFGSYCTDSAQKLNKFAAEFDNYFDLVPVTAN